MAVERQHLRSQGPRLESIPESVSPFPRQAHQDAERREARPKCTQLRNRENRMKWAKDLIHALGTIVLDSSSPKFLHVSRKRLSV